MSTPPTWSPDDRGHPNPFAAPAGGAAPDPESVAYPAAPPVAPPVAPPITPPAAPAPVWGAPADPSPSPYGSSQYPPPAPSPYGAPANPTPGSSPYGAPTGEVPYGSPAGPPSPYGYPAGAPPYGGAPYPAPGYGSPYPQGPGGYPLPPAWGEPPRPTSGLAIASLITSCAGLFGIGVTGPVGIGLGIGALVRIRRTGDKGRGLAIAGIVVGGVMTLLIAGFVVLMVATAATYDDTASWTSSTTEDEEGWPFDDDGTTGSEDLPFYVLPQTFAPGECLEEWPSQYDMSDAVVVDCATLHHAEVTGVVDLTSAPTGSSYDAAYDAAWDVCWTQIEAMGSGALGDTSWVDVFAPHPVQWDAGETSGYCVLVDEDAGMIGSVVAGTATLAGWTQS